ncbi:hypothetical protein GGS24DRAFT_208217 [Hypoxylon argillaceum]|nr:hypothetical protein GGS24DRAFT_208217 [Hypoxylon argillaceum]
MEVISAIASFIAIGQAIAVTPKIIHSLRSFKNAPKELESLIGELEQLYTFYEQVKEKIGLFSDDHDTSLLRIDEPSYLQLVRKELESMVAELQGLVDSCLTEGTRVSKASRIQWWMKQKKIGKLRDECYKQRQQLYHLYTLWKDQHDYKQGQLLVKIHTQVAQVHALVSQKVEDNPPQPSDLPSPKEHCPTTPPDPVQEGSLVAQSDIASLNSTLEVDKAVGRRCGCFCHANKASRRKKQSRYFYMFNDGFVAYQSQTVSGNQCGMNCCAAAQSFVALRFCIPAWFRSWTVTGTFKFGFSSGIQMSLSPRTQFSYGKGYSKLRRVLEFGKPELLNQWLSQYAGSILSVDDGRWGSSVLEYTVLHSRFSLLTYCLTTWPGIIKGTEEGRRTANYSKNALVRNGSRLSADDKLHLVRFIEFMEEDDEDEVLEVIWSMNRVQKLKQALSVTPDLLTKRSILGNTLLHVACLAGDTALVAELLLRRAPINITNHTGFSPLHLACLADSWSSAELLLRAGSQVNTRNSIGDTPLLSAICKVHEDPRGAIRFIKTLVLEGADVRAQSADGTCVWHRIRLASSPRPDLWELYEVLFKAGGAHLIDHMDNDGVTPLQLSIFCNAPLLPFLKQVGARCDITSPHGWTLLYYISVFGSAESCRLAEELEISCIDIRTTDDIETTPLKNFRWQVYKYCNAVKHSRSPLQVTDWDDVCQDIADEDQVSEEKAIALERLLRSIRDRMLLQEIEKLELIMSKLRIPDLTMVRDEIRGIAEGKSKAKIDHEAQTFRAIELDVREGRIELAIESIEEFIAVSWDRMRISPFEEEPNPWELSGSSSVDSTDSLGDEESLVDIEADDEDNAERTPSESDRLLETDDDENDGYKTADED